jgi:hypothetical protein
MVDFGMTGEWFGGSRAGCDYRRTPTMPQGEAWTASALAAALRNWWGWQIALDAADMIESLNTSLAAAGHRVRQ